VCLVVMLVTACSGQGASQEEFDALKRRVIVLEKKTRSMDQQKGGKAKAAQGAAPKPTGPKTPIKATGDALKVVLTVGKRRIAIPAAVPEGEYAIHALFTQGAKPVEAGKLTAKGKAPITVNCTAESSKCEVIE
jgi:hypothetical protein